MKKSLLITLGCSITEGVGCYDYSINPKKELYHNVPETKKKKLRDRFHKYGWPNRVGAKLGYNKVLNLGIGGTGNSVHLKLFVDKILPKLEQLKKEYSIYTLWMMTEPTRFSFYTPNSIRFFHPARAGLHQSTNSLEESYLNTMPEFKIGPAREQVHLIKLSEYMFSSIGIPIAYTSWTAAFQNVYQLYQTPNFLSPHAKDQFYNFDKSKLSQVPGCGHPNEEGYEYMANRIVRLLKIHRPEFIPTHPNTGDLDWEWDASVFYKPEIVKTIL